MHESTILSFPSPTCIAHPSAILLHDYPAVYDSPSDLPFVCYTPYNIGNNNIVYRPSEEQPRRPGAWSGSESAFTRYFYYQYCMVNGQIGGAGRNHMLRNIACNTTEGGGVQ